MPIEEEEEEDKKEEEGIPNLNRRPELVLGLQPPAVASSP